MAIVITLNDKKLDKYPSLHSRMIEELEDRLADDVFKAGFINFTFEDSYTGNTIRELQKPAKSEEAGINKMYRTKTWTPVEIDTKDDVLYSKREDAEREKARLEEMQPENKYEIEEVGQ